MEIRKIRAEEQVPVYLLMRYAFDDWTAEPPSPEDASWASPEDTYAAFDQGRAVACLKSIDCRQNIRGVIKPMRGISAVACSPDYRDRGLATSLMQEAFREMRRERTATSMLLPFKETFYARFGYAAANHNLTVGFPLAAIPAEHRTWAGEGWRYETLPAPEGLERYRRYLTTKSLARHHGMAAAAAVNVEGWRRWHRQAMITFAVRDGEDAGVLFYKKRSYMDTGKLEVAEFFADDPAARSALFVFLARHRGQIAEVKVTWPYGTPFFHWLRDVDRPYEVKLCQLPWYTRVMDVEKALTGVPAGGEGTLAVAVRDDACPDLTGHYRLEARAGVLQAVRGGDGRVTLDIRGLTSFVYGALDAEEIERRGWLRGADEAAKRLLDRWFPRDFIFNTFDF